MSTLFLLVSVPSSNCPVLHVENQIRYADCLSTLWVNTGWNVSSVNFKSVPKYLGAPYVSWSRIPVDQTDETYMKSVVHSYLVQKRYGDHHPILMITHLHIVNALNDLRRTRISRCTPESLLRLCKQCSTCSAGTRNFCEFEGDGAKPRDESDGRSGKQKMSSFAIVTARCSGETYHSNEFVGGS